MLYACQVSSSVCTTMSEWLASLRTTNGYGITPLPSVWSKFAMYRPDTASLGIWEDGVTGQLPQSTRPVLLVLQLSGLPCGVPSLTALSGGLPGVPSRVKFAG